MQGTIPPILQAFSRVIPLTYVSIMVGSIMLKGVGLEVLTGEVSELGVSGAAVLVLSAARFQKGLD